MACGLNEKEEQVRHNKFDDGNECVDSKDLVFVYPNDFKGQPDVVVARLQLVMDYLKDVTNNLDPTDWFNDSRVVIGYEDNIDSAYWTSNDRDKHWIGIPWEQYLNKERELFDVLSHELVHPFYRVSKLHTKEQAWGGNEGWGEGFCDFLRGPVKNIIGLDGRSWWWQMIDAYEKRKPGKRQDPAGQFIKMAQNKYWNPSELNEFVAWFIDDKDCLSDFVSFLFDEFAHRPLSDVLIPTKEMEKQYRDKRMI